MSYKWAVEAVEQLARAQMSEVRDVIKSGQPWFMTHDNVNIPFRTFAQRIDRQHHFDSGTAATVYIQPHAPPIPAVLFQALQNQRTTGSKTPITFQKIMSLERDAAQRLLPHFRWRILQVLLHAPDFDLATYSGRDDPVFTPPKPTRELPCGHDYTTKQYVLETQDVEEASYDGNLKLLGIWHEQLGLGSRAEKIVTGTDHVGVMGGDQLTCGRMRGLFKMRCEDHNGYDRLDWLVVVFGWFHLLMAFANSLHRQYLGTGAGRGLMHAFTILSRKGLGTVQTRGPFHQNLHEAISHVAEAHFRTCWKVIGGVDELAELRDRSPADLAELANRIVTGMSSSDAIENQDSKPKDQRDELLRQSAMWNQDALRYLELHNAMKRGDIGLMEDMLPYLLFRFIGGRNSKYAIEILELLQSLHFEWPAELRCDSNLVNIGPFGN